MMAYTKGRDGIAFKAVADLREARMNSKMIVIILIALGIFAFMGLNQPQDNTDVSNVQLQEPGLQITGTNTSVGQGSSEFRQTITFNAVLLNAETAPVYIESAEALLSQGIKSRVSSGQTLIAIEKELAPGETLEIGGQIEFNSEALSKKDIDAMGSLITGFRLNSYSIALLPGR